MDFGTFAVLSEPFEKVRADEELNASSLDIAVSAYAALSAELRDIIIKHPRFTPYLELLHFVGERVEAHIKSKIYPGRVERPFLPLLTEEDVTSLARQIRRRMEATQDENTRNTVAVAAVAAYGYETRSLWSTEISSNSQLPLDFTIELGSYGFWKTAQSQFREELNWPETREAIQIFISEQTSQVDQAVQRSRAGTARVDGILGEYRSQIGDMLSTSRTLLSEVQSDVSDQRLKTKKQQEAFEGLATQISASEENVKAFTNAVREELKIDATKKLWEQRAKDNKKAFWASAFVIAVLILVPAIFVLICPEAIVRFLERITQAAKPMDGDLNTTAQLTAATISKIVIISAPLAVYFWAIKLVVRFNTRCMLLMDDARQRHTTMDTYFHLIERSGATTEERGLMLNALFRPIAGQGQDNVDPPNFIELINKGKE
jgi:hypothetical protein